MRSQQSFCSRFFRKFKQSSHSCVMHYVMFVRHCDTHLVMDVGLSFVSRFGNVGWELIASMASMMSVRLAVSRFRVVSAMRHSLQSSWSCSFVCSSKNSRVSCHSDAKSIPSCRTIQPAPTRHYQHRRHRQTSRESAMPPHTTSKRSVRNRNRARRASNRSNCHTPLSHTDHRNPNPIPRHRTRNNKKANKSVQPTPQSVAIQCFVVSSNIFLYSRRRLTFDVRTHYAKPSLDSTQTHVSSQCR